MFQVQWHDSSVSSFYPGKAHSVVCPQCFTCDMILLKLFSWLCWVIVVLHRIVLETGQLSPWHALSGVWKLQYLQLCRFSYSVAYVMLVSQSGIVPSSPTLQGGWLITGPPGKAPVKCFKCLLLHPVSKRHIVWWEYITIQGCKYLTCFKNFFIHTAQIQPGVYHHKVPFHALLHWLLIEHIQ